MSEDHLSRLKALKLYGMAEAWSELRANTGRSAGVERRNAAEIVRCGTGGTAFQKFTLSNEVGAFST